MKGIQGGEYFLEYRCTVHTLSSLGQNTQLPSNQPSFGVLLCNYVNFSSGTSGHCDAYTGRNAFCYLCSLIVEPISI